MLIRADALGWAGRTNAVNQKREGSMADSIMVIERYEDEVKEVCLKVRQSKKKVYPYVVWRYNGNETAVLLSEKPLRGKAVYSTFTKLYEKKYT